MVRKVLLVIPRLDYSGSARLLCMLAAGLPAGSVHVCVLGGPAPWCDDLRAAGVAVHVLHWRWAIDLRPLAALHALIARERPESVHAWGFGAAWPLVLSGCRPGMLLLSAALPPKRRLSLAERWLLRRCGRVIALGDAEAEVYRRLGVDASRIGVVPPATPLPAATAAPASLPELPESARVVLAVGPIARHKGHRDAVWAFDILRCLYDDLHLVIVGNGPDEQRVRRFTELIRLTNAVHLIGPVADLRPWLARAVVVWTPSLREVIDEFLQEISPGRAGEVWTPSLREGGRQTALEAMAAGRPVVASRLPGLAEVVIDGQTGFLVTPGDKAELARQTRLLLDNPDLRQRMGEAGRQRVEESFAPARLIEAFEKIYSQA